MSQFPLPLPPIFPAGVPSGFPTCSTDLQAQTVTCTGLVPSESYSVRDSRSGESHGAAADNTGAMTVAFSTGGIHRGDQLGLSNGSRTLTTLHVANLRVDITGEQTVLSGGSCSAGEYYAPPLGAAPTNTSAGDPTGFVGGAALTDSVCR